MDAAEKRKAYLLMLKVSKPGSHLKQSPAASPSRAGSANRPLTSAARNRAGLRASAAATTASTSNRSRGQSTADVAAVAPIASKWLKPTPTSTAQGDTAASAQSSDESDVDLSVSSVSDVSLKPTTRPTQFKTADEFLFDDEDDPSDHGILGNASYGRHLSNSTVARRESSTPPLVSDEDERDVSAHHSPSRPAFPGGLMTIDDLLSQQAPHTPIDSGAGGVENRLESPTSLTVPSETESLSRHSGRSRRSSDDQRIGQERRASPPSDENMQQAPSPVKPLGIGNPMTLDDLLAGHSTTQRESPPSPSKAGPQRSTHERRSESHVLQREPLDVSEVSSASVVSDVASEASVNLSAADASQASRNETSDAAHYSDDDDFEAESSFKLPSSSIQSPESRPRTATDKHDKTRRRRSPPSHPTDSDHRYSSDRSGNRHHRRHRKEHHGGHRQRSDSRSWSETETQTETSEMSRSRSSRDRKRHHGRRHSRAHHHRHEGDSALEAYNRLLQGWSSQAQPFVPPTLFAHNVVSPAQVEALAAYTPAAMAINRLFKQQLQLIQQFVDTNRRTVARLEQAQRLSEHPPPPSTKPFQYTTLEDTLKEIASMREARSVNGSRVRQDSRVRRGTSMSPEGTDSEHRPRTRDPKSETDSRTGEPSGSDDARLAAAAAGSRHVRDEDASVEQQLAHEVSSAAAVSQGTRPTAVAIKEDEQASEAHQRHLRNSDSVFSD